MDLREFAESLLVADTLDAKLRPPPRDLGDGAAGGAPALRRPPGLEIRQGGRVRVPPATAWADVAQRVRILHAAANHELQAAELFAWAILTFPDEPDAVRRGWLRVLADEQRHCRMYCDRLLALGSHFGAFPVSGHFWSKSKDIRTALQFHCVMGLTFENANLDFGGEYADAARAAGDHESAEILLAVHRDEIHHVRFAWEGLLRLKQPQESAWEAYCRSVIPPHGPSRARGAVFDKVSRIAAGLDDEFIARLEATPPDAPGGAPRR